MAEETQETKEIQEELDKKKAKPKINVNTALIVTVLILALLPIPLKLFFLSEGMSDFTRANTSSNEAVFKKRLKDSFKHFELARLCNTFSFFSRAGESEIAYRLGLVLLYQRNNEQARPYFEEAKSLLKGKDTFASAEDIELNLLQCQIKLDGFVDGNQAMVNQHLVKEGDVINGITVLRITKNYILFKGGDFVFSDSLDKYTPSTKKLGQACQGLLSSAEKDTMGFARVYYRLAKRCAKDLLCCVTMDVEQADAMKKIIVESDRKVAQIDTAIAGAKKSRTVIVGMDKKDAEDILGKPLEKKKLFEMAYNEQWLYGDSTLYFKDDAKYGIAGIVAKIEHTFNIKTIPSQ